MGRSFRGRTLSIVSKSRKDGSVFATVKKLKKSVLMSFFTKKEPARSGSSPQDLLCTLRLNCMTGKNLS